MNTKRRRGCWFWWQTGWFSPWRGYVISVDGRAGYAWIGRLHFGWQVMKNGFLFGLGFFAVPLLCWGLAALVEAIPPLYFQPWRNPVRDIGLALAGAALLVVVIVIA